MTTTAPILAAAGSEPDLSGTLTAAFQQTVRRVPDRTAIRTLGDATVVTWQLYGQKVESYARVLAGLGVRRGDTVALMTVNGPDFHFLDTAAMHVGAIPISIYNTLPVDDIAWILENAQAKVVIAEAAFVPTLLKVKDLDRGLATVVSLEPVEGAMSWSELPEASAADFDFEAAWRAVSAGDPATVSYTSGTTGHPKGVVLTHEGILGSLAGLDEVIDTVEGGRVVSFLPMAHVAERMFSHYRGIAYGLTVTSCPDVRQVPAHLVDARPHYLFSPPRLFEKLQATIEARASGDGADAVALRSAIELGLEVVDLKQSDQAVPDELAQSYADASAAVLEPLLAQLGLDQIAVALTGSAPVPPALVRYFLALGVNALEAWGMSECSAFGSINRLDDVRLGTVGYPLPGLELKLLDDGEIVLRSPWLMREYLNRPELTAETIDADGWLHTGDIGAYDDAGRLKIVDRKKELIISAFGKNMSPSNIEAKLKGANPIVGQAVCIGDARPYNVALLVLDAEVAGAVAGRKAPVAELAKDPKVLAAVEQAVVDANDQLSRVEQLKKHVLLAEEWLPGGDELSPTMKLKRKPIAEKYADVITALYA